jgi:hypothetical protein
VRPKLEGLERRELLAHYSSGTVNASLEYDKTLQTSYGSLHVYEHIKEDVTFTASGKDSYNITYNTQTGGIGKFQLGSKVYNGVWTDTISGNQKGQFLYGFVLSTDGHGHATGNIPKLSIPATETKKFVVNGVTLYKKSTSVSIWVVPDVFVGTYSGNKLPAHLSAMVNYTDSSGVQHHGNWSIYP